MSLWHDYFHDVDTLDVDSIVSWMTPDAEMVFGNWPRVEGRAAIHRTLSDFVGKLGGLRHKITLELPSQHEVFTEAEVTYTVGDHREVTVPAGTYMAIRDGKISSLRVYLDLSPVFAAMA